MNTLLEQISSGAESLARYINQGGADPLVIGKQAELILLRAKNYVMEETPEPSGVEVPTHL